MLLYNLPSIPDPKGFLWITLKDRDIMSDEPFEQFYIPLNFLQNFKPVNLEIQCKNSSNTSKPTFFMSLCLEKQLENFADSISSVTVHWADFDPLPYDQKAFNCVFTTDNYPISRSLIYYPVELIDETSMARAF